MTSAEVARLRGHQIMAQPLLNKDAAFTQTERDALGLRGLLPWRVATLDEQVALELEHLRRKTDDLEKYIGLAALQDRNETLFYRLLCDHIEELAPIVYTPTVGEACRRFSHIIRRPRGVWITPDDIACIPQLLRNADRPGIRLIVVTDNERILGLGDQGAGGMGIPVGKLALYSAGAGIDPRLTLPVSLDCGTDNADLLADPMYLGYPRFRLRGGVYDDFVAAFVDAVTAVFPEALLQWEDFKQHNAIRLLDRYATRLPSFNDDIQGTAAVVLAGILAALRRRGEPLSAQRLVFLGAGAAGIGIARLAATIMRTEDPHIDLHAATVMLDSRGLIFSGRDHLDDDKLEFALPPHAMARYGFGPSGAASRYDLAATVRKVAPTILIGTSGTPGSFTEEVISEMAARTPAPIVLPLSNPTAKSEATPADVLRWSEGRALVATGSPFDPVEFGGRRHVIGQANNVFVFPGVGLGAIAARARVVTDRMFLAAAMTLASMVPAQRLAAGALYPGLADLRQVSRAIAVAVATEARDSGASRLPPGEDVAAAVDAAIWAADYPAAAPATLRRDPVTPSAARPGRCRTTSGSPRGRGPRNPANRSRCRAVPR
jgi:malic enzyme